MSWVENVWTITIASKCGQLIVLKTLCSKYCEKTVPFMLHHWWPINSCWLPVYSCWCAARPLKAMISLLLFWMVIFFTYCSHVSKSKMFAQNTRGRFFFCKFLSCLIWPPLICDWWLRVYVSSCVQIYQKTLLKTFSVWTLSCHPVSAWSFSRCSA